MPVQINVAANQAALMASIQAGVQAYNQKFAQNNQINLSINARAFSQPLGRITGDVKDFEAALAASNARVIAFGASTAVLGGVIRGFKELATVTIEVEKNLADINRVFGLTTNQLQKFSTDLFNVSKSTASGFNEASKAALEFSRQGLKAEDVLTRTKDALTLTRLAGIGTANAVDALTSTVNGFAATGVTTTQILNKLVAVEQDYAVGAGDLAEALSRTGQAAQEAGVSLDQLNALVTAAQQSTARGGAVIGNALKTIFTRLQRTETLDQLEAFNISVRDVQGNILPAVTILQNFAGAYKNLADAQKAQLSEQVAGVYQVNILKAIVNDLNKSQGVYAGALQRGASATNEAEIATAKLNKTLDALLSQTATSTQQLANNIGKVTFEPLAKYGTEQLKSFVESINEVLEGEGAGSTFANGLLKGIRNVIAGPGAIAAFFTLFKLIQNSFTYLSQALPQIAGITTETQNRKNIESAILQIMAQQGTVAQALDGLTGNQAAQAQLLLQTARAQTAEYQKQAALAQQLAVQLSGQGVKVAGSRGLQVTRAGGYVPPATRMAEIVGAQAGGYAPGQVVPSPVGGVMNTAESVRYIPGFAQPFINPPANSDAGRAHRQNSISRTGVDPYTANGFIPNFAVAQDSIENIAKKYPHVRSALNKDTGLEKNDEVILSSFNREVVPFSKAENKMSLKDREKAYEYRIINKILKFNDNKNLFNQGNSAIDGYFGNMFAEVKSGSYSLTEVKEKFLRAPAENAYLKNQNWNIFHKNQHDQKNVDGVLVTPKSKGFIPNFAPPTSAIRVPWFRKFGNASFDAIQPTLGISRASDTDTFRSSQFRSKAFEKAATDGDPNLFAPLYEDFIFKALQLVSQPKIKDQLIRGYVLQPGTDQKQSAFDAFLGDVGLEFKGFPKGNLTGSISKNLNDKYERYAKANPTGAAKIKESIIAFNEIGDKNQITSDFGKNFSQLAGTSYSEMLKNNPDLVKGLSAETNMLLQRYVKNPAFLAVASSRGFIPNFAYKQSVMGLEESMSGNKAIFDTKPFPHIRNSSQPTFSSAIADHGGLGNALSDSMRGQKAAGLMSKGFIPNFAPKSYRYSGRGSVIDPSSGISQYSAGLGFNLADQERRARDEFNRIINALRTGAMNAQQATDAFNTLNTQAGLSAKAQTSLTRILNREVAAAGISGAGSAGNSRLAKFSENLSKASTAISIAGPMLAGFAEQAVFGNRQRTEMTSGERAGQSILSTGLSAVSTGAGIGSAFGLPGTILGGAVGGLVALTSALNATTLSAEELAQLNQEQVQKSQASISAASSYIEAQKSLTQMIASGASSSDIEIATKKLSDNFNEIKDVKLQEIFNATGGDVALMTKQLQDYTNQVTKESARQSGLYGTNLKSEERASALSIGLGKEGSKNFIESTRKALQEAQKASDVIDKNAGLVKGNTPFTKFLYSLGEVDRKIAKKPIFKNFAENIVPQNEPERESKIKALVENLLTNNFEEVLNSLEKMNLTSDANKIIQNFNQRATKSFNQIFLEIEQQIAKSAFDVALSFEKDSGSRRIQSAILDFSTNFQDSINSFLSNNLPDARKFDFTAATAGQKAQLQLQKSQQDYDKALAEQANDRSNFLIKNAENLTKEFKSSFLPSQASAEFFQKEVLPQIQAGTFSGSASSLATQFQTAAFNKADVAAKAVGISDLSESNTEKKLKFINDIIERLNKEGETTGVLYDQLLTARRSIIELEKQTALFVNQNDEKKMQGLIESFDREKQLFDLKQANAKKELEINKQLNEARIAVEKDIAIEKARVDKENLMRMESMKDLSANIGNALEISKARSAATVNAMQRRLEDQRETFGMSRTQISERKFGIQADILKEQRKAEDAAINAEIQQRVLEMAAEQENTAATLELNKTIMQLIETQLQGALGGSEVIKEMQNNPYAGMTDQQINSSTPINYEDMQLREKAMSSYSPLQRSQFAALQRIQESRVASAASNTGYNTSTFESNIQSKGFNEKMTQAEQLTFLEKEETAARSAGNLVLAGTIKRYQDQIKTKQQALQITRDDIDAQVRLNTEIERVNNTFAGRFRKGWGNLTSEADDLVLNLGENLPKMFGDGLVDGIKAAIRESNNLGEALMGIASKFLDSISTTLMQSAVYGILGSIGVPNLPVGGKQRGGIIRAQSGMYISGTGSGDKYPALLENGEYVLNRRAVMAMGGPSELDKLNFSMAPRFASGGSFSNQFEDLTSMEANMTTAGLEESKLYNELRDVKRQEAEQDRQKKRARQQQMAGLIGSVVAGVVTAGIGAGISNKMQNVQAGKAMNLSAKLQTGQPLTNAESLSIRPLMDKGLISPTGLYTGPSVVRTGFSGFTGYGGRQIGGSIGSRLSDTIPGYATGGLFETPIVKRYAIGGGASGSGFGAATAASNNMINNNTNANNSFSFNTTVSRDNKIEIGANTTSYAQQDIELSQNLNSRIYETVLETIRNEKRFGGSLAGVRNR